MINPFPKEIHAIVETGNDDSWVLDYPTFSMETRNWTKEQAEYAAQAINTHDKLKAEVVEWRNMVAVLCRDGGHYLNVHGIQVTRKSIENEFYTLLGKREKE